ncbi:hypothetical protein QU481_21115 [Crenobacter sp. SG2303]|uniref:Uncharacterized protein n=1 Tax=Crenobacter oryzisoli TaxID=3056844 RepID=A0ABT7XU67_9NEIS|nr:hypothetical protein [Crenobacter sp. SG2303]MDN0077337.1 hypothetical protein [Crenobacter sp. SG2303]
MDPKKIIRHVLRLRFHNDAWAGDLLVCLIGILIALLVMLY